MPTKKQRIEYTRKALEEFNRLPPEEQVRRLVAKGTINEKGEVLMGLEEAKALEQAERDKTSPAQGQ